MSINGQQNINIGLPNEAIGSDSLFTAFTKTQQNFTTLFTNASSYTNFVGSNGIGVTANSETGTVTITNQGVTNIQAGTGIVINSSNGNVTISATGNGNGSGGTVTSVGVYPVSNSRLTSSRSSPVVSSGDFLLDLASSGVIAGNYVNPTLAVDAYGRITAASNNTVAGTVTSVGLTPGPGIQVAGGPVTSNGNITVTNTGVLRINAGTGISLSSGNGNVTISSTVFGGTVTSVNVTSNNLLVTGSPIVNAGTINIDLPNSVSFTGNVSASNVNANFIRGNGGNINGNLIVIGNISPAGNNKVGGIKPGPGVNISLDGELTIDTANLPLSFGNFTANNNVLSIVNVDEDMILQTDGNAEIQLIGNIGFYIPDGLPPNIANRYFYATTDGSVHSKYLDIQSFGETGLAAPFNVTIDTTGNYRPPAVLSGTIAQFTGNGNTRSYVVHDNYGVDPASKTGGTYVFRTARGNVDAPAAVQSNDILGEINATGWASNGYGGQASGFYRIVANENFTSTARGGRLEMWVVPNGTITETKIATINSNGLSVTGIANISGNANVGNLGTNGLIVAIGNVTGGNLTTGGVVAATGNVSGGNLVTTGSANVTGNVNAGNLVLTTGNIIYTPRYGAFYSNVDQTNPVANTAMAMTFNNTTTANGVSVVSNSRLTIAKTGVYNIQFSAQLSKTGGGTGVADIWLAKDGTPVDWTNTSIPVTSGSPEVAAWNFVENVTVANTYFEIMWSSPDTLITLNASAANTGPTRPGIPSVIVTVTPVGA